MHIKRAFKFLSTDVRRGWVLCNIVLAAGPILVTALSGSRNVFPATLTYCYALLVVGVYLFFRYVRSHRDVSTPDLIAEQGYTMFWSSIILAVAFLVLLTVYNSNSRMVEIVNGHLATTIGLCLAIIFVAFLLAYKLNWPIISEEEAELERRRKEAVGGYDKADAASKGARKAGKTVKAELGRKE